MAKKIIIIGGGIAGLAAGVYGRMNGFETEIYEMHAISGGLCTAWKRKGYTFDGCIHWLTGSSPGSHFHRFWKEVGALKGGDVVEHDEYMRSYDENGEETVFATNIDRLCRELMRIGPEDEEVIKELRRLVMKLGDVPIPTRLRESMSFWDNLKMFKAMLPYLKDMGKALKMPLEEFIARFKSGSLRRAFSSFLPIKDIPLFCLIYMLAVLHKRTAGWYLGGSLKFARNIEQRYRALGGKIHFGKRVEKILTDKRGAYGILLADGSRAEGDLVISAADGYSTIYKMLEGRYTSKEIDRRYQEDELFTPFIQISLGVKADLSAYSHRRTFTLRRGSKVGMTEVERLFVNHYCFDPSMAPAGKSSLVILISSPWEKWQGIEYNSKEYLREKMAIEHDIKLLIKERLPEVHDRIEVLDIATPHTTVRYTANWKSAYQGFLPTINTMNSPISKRLPGLKRFYMIGQWTSVGGGLPMAVQDGRGIIELLCKRERKDFLTS